MPTTDMEETMTSTPKNTSGPHRNTPAEENTAHAKNKTNQSELRESSHDAWDAAFESDDPTVVLLSLIHI